MEQRITENKVLEFKTLTMNKRVFDQIENATRGNVVLPDEWIGYSLVEIKGLYQRQETWFIGIKTDKLMRYPYYLVFEGIWAKDLSMNRDTVTKYIDQLKAKLTQIFIK